MLWDKATQRHFWTSVMLVCSPFSVTFHDQNRLTSSEFLKVQVSNMAVMKPIKCRWWMENLQFSWARVKRLDNIYRRRLNEPQFLKGFKLERNLSLGLAKGKFFTFWCYNSKQHKSSYFSLSETKVGNYFDRKNMMKPQSVPNIKDLHLTFFLKNTLTQRNGI